MKLVLLGSGCIREDAMEIQFLEKMKEYGIERGTKIEDADYFLYITCAGVGDTIKKNMKELYSIMQVKNPNTKVIVVGCLTKHRSLFKYLEQEDNFKIITNNDWIVPVFNYINNENKRNSYKTMLTNRTRRFYNSQVCLQFILEEGCINTCSFCKTNYDGRYVKSVPYDVALDYLREQIKKGTKSILLSGTNLTLYGIDLYKKQVLHNFIHDLSLIEGLEQIQVYELTTANMYPELLEELKNNIKVKGVSMQLETADDRLLKLMNRRHALDEYDYYVMELKKAGKYVSTILMSAFPTETYDSLDKTISYIKDRGITVSDVCEYVDFEYIPSSKLKQLPYREKKSHTKYLNQAVNENNFKIYTEDVSRLRNTIFVGSLYGYKIFQCENGCTGISKRKIYDDYEIGTVINDSPLRLVKHSSFNKDYAYKF